MLQNIILTNQEWSTCNSFFAHDQINKAQKLLEKGGVSISFSKGNNDKFIISGLVSDGGTKQVKINFDQNNLTSKCTCNEWDHEFHCVHSSALFIHYLKNKASKENLPKDASLKSHVKFFGQSVHVENYGRITRNANELMGASINSTYSSLQYLLTNKETKNFPLPKKFEGTIEINFTPATELDEYKDFHHLKNDYYPLFSYKHEGVEYKKISIFESLYLFNWETGECFNIPLELKNILKKTLVDGLNADINQHIKNYAGLIENEQLNLLIEGSLIHPNDALDAKFRFSIDQAKRRGFLNLKLEITNSEDQLVAIPSIFKVITNENGFLSSFRTKTDSYEFIKGLISSLDFNNEEYKKLTFSSSKRKEICDWVDYLKKPEILFYDKDIKKCIQISSEQLRFIIKSFFTDFTESAVRFSHLNTETKNITFQLPKSHLFNGVTAFYIKMEPLGIPIFYNDKQVRTWSTNIRFERKQSPLDWFAIDLVVDEKDYEVIKNAEINEDYIVSNDGLILLSSKERELLKFMKKYTKHEAQEENQNEDGLKKFSLNFKRSRIFELFELKKHGIDGALNQEEEDLCENLLNLQEMPSYPVPSKFENIPRDYQKTGYNWLRFLYEHKLGACLADDMGLGKTLQTIIFLESIIDQVENILIVCPVSILLNWKNEIEKFSSLSDYIQMYYGEERNLDKSKKITLTSYGVMKKESSITFKDHQFDIIIMDEVQHLKNIRSQGAIAARELQARFRICLTGTPVENDLSEFYNIMDLSIPGIWGDLSMIRSTSSKKSRLIARKTVRPFILRRTKEQVLTELPEKIENHVYLNFSEGEHENYISTLTKIKNNFNAVEKKNKYSEVLKSLLQLRQMCLWQKSSTLHSTKVDFLIENLEQLLEEGHKVLVFSQFTTYLDIIQDKIREHSWKFARIDGSQTMKKRQSQVEFFQEGDAQVFLISLKAGGVGLNLTAASYIFLMDPWWNPAVENQAIDRAYRIGQENKLTVYRPIIKNSVEEKVLILQNTKKELFKDLMATDKDEFFNGKLTMDDFTELLT